jgi:glucose/arabinose dehydrogenase
MLSLVLLLLMMITMVAALSHAAITTELVASALNRPIYCTAPVGDADRLFIVEQRGVIRILESGQLLATPFLDIDVLVPNISGNDERGLLGLAFHPGYSANGYFFVNYTNLAGDTVIARYQVSADPNLADPMSAEVLLTIDQPFTNHNGGQLAFGPNDGHLYIGMGDGGGSGDPGNRAQNDSTLLGKMLRIDVDAGLPYVIPPANPFVGIGGVREEIWAKGLRNPYRWSFDRLTGDLYIADVGQGQLEEVDFQPAASAGGENYGWRIMEGRSCFDNTTPPGCFHPSLTDPVHEYTHGGSPFRCSITGGYVYRGTSLPEIQGHYFFADWCSAQIWSFEMVGGAAGPVTDRTAELAPAGGLTIGNIAGFGEDGNGELYIVDRGAGTSAGEVFKIVAGATGVTASPAPPLMFRLGPALPNPFRAGTSVELILDAASGVEAGIYDAAGRLLRIIRDGEPTAAGRHRLAWDGHDTHGHRLASGVYFLRVTAAGRTESRRVTLVR